MKTNERPNSDTRVDRQLRAGNAMYRGGYIAMIERKLAEAHAEIGLYRMKLEASKEQRDRLADLLIESQSSIAGDWRTRRDKTLAAVKGGPQ